MHSPAIEQYNFTIILIANTEAQEYVLNTLIIYSRTARVDNLWYIQ